ncbi:VWA domain-containing protein [Burkholderia cenocepacia]|uniref:VWA domain-containing protein n=1 Tax=Burkholderia cenocepacia TaxID=95486 RepID=UPI001B8E53E6|nr:VWA domain-containing protein [Burkholderia cenocepacia]MBR8043471.1 VWA domain-containing protein [Burkholderia cenocepacia]MBR8327847.1 VWA domain-containing protein [Burkholderia cenocepacia]
MKDGQARYRNQLLTARILAGRCDLELKVSGNISTAMTDGKSVWYPQAWMLTDSEEMGIVMDGIIDHEAAGHGRHTDFSVKQPKHPLVRRLANIFEDIWCEISAGHHWPGIPANLARTVEVLTDWGLFGSPESMARGEPGQLMCNALLVNCRARFLPGQGEPLKHHAAAAWQAAESRFGSIWHQAWKLASRSPDLRTTREATDLAVSVFKLLQSESEEPDRPNVPSNPGAEGSDGPEPHDNPGKGGGDDEPADDQGGQPSSSDSGESGQTGGDSNETGEGGSGDSDNDGSGESDSGNPSGQSGASSAGSSGESGQGAASGGNPGSGSLAEGPTAEQRAAVRDACETPDTDLPPTDLGQLAGQAVSERLQQRTAKARMIRLNAPVPVAPKEAIPRSWHVLGTRVRNTLAGELDAYLEARVTRHTQRGYSGRRIDTSRLPRLRVGDARVFRTRHEEEGLNTAISVVIDLSPSMSYPLGKVEQVMSAGATPVIDGVAQHQQFTVRRDQAAGATAVALAPIFEMYDVPFEVISYAAGYQIIKSFDDGWEEVSRRSHAVASVGRSTATGMAMTVALSNLILRDEDRRMMVLLTDGAAGDPVMTAASYQAAKEAGVEVVTIFIGRDIQAIALTRSILNATGFGQHFSNVNSPDELAKGVIDAMRSVF